MEEDQPENKNISLAAETAVSENWKHGIRRIIRRSAIKRLQGSASLTEKFQHLVKAFRGESGGVSPKVFNVREQVRDFEQKVGVDRLTKDLTESEVLIDEKMANVAGEIYELISAEYPDVAAVVLMGSSVHGGARVREATGLEAEGEKDLDWGVLTKSFIGSNLIGRRVNSLAKSHINNLKQKYNLDPHFHICKEVNPEKYAFEILTGQQQAEGILRDYGKKRGLYDNFMTGVWEKRLLAYFQPSFPASVNEKNRAFILGALKDIAISDHVLWEDLVTKLSDAWKKHHRLREKHFYKVGNETDRNYVDYATQASAHVMAEPFVRMLLGTHN